VVTGVLPATKVLCKQYEMFRWSFLLQSTDPSFLGMTSTRHSGCSLSAIRRGISLVVKIACHADEGSICELPFNKPEFSDCLNAIDSQAPKERDN
jgi:hypothetical protein